MINCLDESGKKSCNVKFPVVSGLLIGGLGRHEGTVHSALLPISPMPFRVDKQGQ